MIPWPTLKSIKTANPTYLLFYTSELDFHSNRDGQSDVYRYYIYIDNNGVRNESFIIKESPENADQIDFDTNYKAEAILF